MGWGNEKDGELMTCRWNVFRGVVRVRYWNAMNR